MRYAVATLASMALLSTAGCTDVESGSASSGTTSTLAAPLTSVPATGVIGTLAIPRFDVHAPIHAIGTQQMPDPYLDGAVVSSFGGPPDMASTAWWSDGPPIGGDEMAVVIGRAADAGPGIFNDIEHLNVGDEIAIRLDVEGLVTYRVIEVHGAVPKRDANALGNALSGHPSNARLALLTDGGTFDPTTNSGDANVIVFAEETAQTKH